MAPTTRAKSKANSVASEEAGPHGGLSFPGKNRTKKFDPAAALYTIVNQGETAHINTLTISQAKAVLRLATDELRAQRAEIQERDDEIEHLTRERDEALARQPRSKLRDYMFAKKLQAASASPAATPQLAITSGSGDEQLAPTSEEPAQLEGPTTAQKNVQTQTSPTQKSTPVNAQPPQAGSDAAAPETPATQIRAPLRTAAQTEPAIPRWKALVNSVGGFISPLSRKRPAPQEQESDTSKKAKKDNVVITIQRPSVEDDKAPSSLSTVIERTEYSEESTLMPDPTPSRPPKRKAKDLDSDLGVPEAASTPLVRSEQAGNRQQQNKTRDITFNVPDLRPPSSNMPPQQTAPSPVRATPQRRTVRDVIAARSARAGSPIKPRAWEGTPVPKEKNADARLEKLQRLEQMEKEKKRLDEALKELNEDSEVKSIIGHRVKRVKIDDLVTIPARPPGSTAGSYGFPDLDSDEEMEVDEDAEIIKNVFEEAAEQPAAAPPPSTSAPNTTTAAISAPTPVLQVTPSTPGPTPAPAASVESMVDWASVAVGPKPADYVESTEEEKEAYHQQFKRQFELFASQLAVK